MNVVSTVSSIAMSLIVLFSMLYSSNDIFYFAKCDISKLTLGYDIAALCLAAI
jgi:hypothetical protein